VVNTYPLSCHSSPAAARSASCRRRCSRSSRLISKVQRFGYSPGQVLDARRGVDLDGLHPEVAGLFAHAVGEQAVAFEQVAQRPRCVAGLAGDVPERSPSGERRPAELRRGKQPHGASGVGQQRPDQLRQEPEALHQHTGLDR
jgi:hypothetical protein